MEIKNKKVKAIATHLSRYTQMLARCYDTSSKAYQSYGAKGVTVCEEWLDSPNAFIEWCESNGWDYHLVLDKDILSDKLGIYPKIYSPATCQFITQKENMEYTLKNTLRRAVACYDSKGNFINVYKSVTEAEQALEIGNIGRAARGKRKTVKNMYWRYVEDYKNVPRHIEIPRTKRRGNPIHEIDKNGSTIGTFINCVEAAEKTGLKASSINQVVNGLRNSVYGRVFIISKE